MKGKLEEKKPIQGRFEGAAATMQLKEASATNRTGLPDQVKAGVESLSGLSLDDVKVHYNSGKPAQLNALAYAQGTDIHVAPGQEQHLPHEAWHIVQQKQGRVQPTMQMKVGVPINDDAGLEKEADVMGAAALQRIAIAGAENDLSLQKDYGHAQDCACPACCQTKPALSRETALERQEVESPGSHASPHDSTLQARSIGIIQMKPCPECKKAKGHLSWCSRNPHNRGVKAEEQQAAHQESRAWTNLKAYRGSWVTDNNITESQVKKFCKSTGRTIRGHASGDNSKGEQGNTTEDLGVFKTWFTQQYGGWQ
jgi:hypothetical protein